jgi:hypothetical protein
MSRVLREEEALKFQNEMRPLKDKAVEQGLPRWSVHKRHATTRVLLMCCSCVADES